MHPTAALRFLTIAFACFGLTACGVTFSSDFEGTELFKGITVSGDLTQGSEVTVTTVVNQAYPVPLLVSCMYEDVHDLTDDEARVAFHERARVAGSAVLEPNLDTRPGDEVAERVISFDFVVEKTGDYFVACLTPAAPENGFGMVFNVKEAE